MFTYKQALIPFFLLVFCFSGITQENLDVALVYEINPTQSSDRISRMEFNKSESIFDLDRFSKSSWVREYVSIELRTIQNGEIKKQFLRNDILGQKEKDVINTVDVGTECSILIKYFPENNLKENEVKELEINFTIIPDKKAEYIEGYLKENITDEILNIPLREYQLMAVKFTINKKGEIENAHIFESSKDEKIDKMILGIMNEMPDWKPAEYNNGTKVEQEFALTIGDHRSCVMNLLYLP